MSRSLARRPATAIAAARSGSSEGDRASCAQTASAGLDEVQPMLDADS